MNSFKAAKLLVTEGAPAGVYDNLGNSALSLLIEKIPEVALMALDQLRTTNALQRREYYFLNYLEGAKLKEELQETPARSPLEIAVENDRFDLPRSILFCSVLCCPALFCSVLSCAVLFLQIMYFSIYQIRCRYASSHEKTYSSQVEILWEERCYLGSCIKPDLYNIVDCCGCHVPTTWKRFVSTIDKSYMEDYNSWLDCPLHSI